MTNIYVGFHDQRSCNRILKPPGGGTSNIFGTDYVPDVVPQMSPQKGNKPGETVQQILQSEVVTTVTTQQERSSSTNGGSTVEKVCKLETNGHGNINGNNLEEVALVTQDDIQQQNGNSTPDILEVTSQVEQIRIEERSSRSQVTETDSAGNTKVILNDSNSEGSVEKSSNFKRGTSIEDVLKHDDIEQKKKVKGPVQRVPPGGYSSGLW